MRSHAKASTAGSTQRQARGLGRIFREAFATRGVASDAKGSSAPKARRLILPVSVFATILVLAVGSASAANGVVSFFGSFGFESESEITKGGKFVFASGVAVNQEGTGGASVGDVYVVDGFSHRVQQFSAGGAFIRTFGLDVGGAGVNVCTVAASCTAGTNSAAAGGMSFPQGIAIDQANGNLYVTDEGNRRIDVFSANGTFQGAFGWNVDATTPEEKLQLCTTASGCQAGSSGANAGQFGGSIGYPTVAPVGSPNASDVYVADKENQRVDQFEPTIVAGEVTGIAFVKGWGWGVDTGAAEFEQCTTASACQAPNTSFPTSNPGQFSFGQPQAVAVDSNGNVYTAESTGNNRAQKFDSSGNPTVFNAAELNGSPGPDDIAVDKTNDHVFAIKSVSGEKRVLEFNAAGAFIESHASGTSITAASGLAVVQGTTNFYLSSNREPTSTTPRIRGVFFLGTKVPPTATVEAPSPLTAHSATIRGKVNPLGFETAYRFELSADEGSTWQSIPASDVSLGNGSGEVAVSQEVNGLIGGHSYSYRIVATKPFGAGTTTSSQETFTTPASAPQIAATFTSAVTTKSAVLRAQINPNGQATSYHFEYGSADCASNPCTSVPAAEVGIGAGEALVGAVQEIGGLQPSTTYHFRAVATNATGTTEGPDTVFRTFATPSLQTDCPNQAFRTGPAANLPNCRAYEMVSPIEKSGGNIYPPFCCGNDSNGYFEQASLSGEKITYTSGAAFGDQVSAANANQYIASRGAGGWSSHGINPPMGISAFPFFEAPAPSPDYLLDSPFEAFSPDLSSAWVLNANKVPLTADAAQGFGNLYRRDNVGESFEALTVNAPTSLGDAYPPKGMGLEFRDASADNSHQVFDAKAAMTPDAATSEHRQIYDFSGGDLHLVSVLPDGTAASGDSFVGTAGIDTNGSEKNSRRGSIKGAVSEDGSRIFWTTGPPLSEGTAVGTIYLRENPEQPQSALNGSGECTEAAKACTIPVSESVSTKRSRFWAADPTGSKAIFGLGGLENGGNEDLYAFDVETETPTLIASEVEGMLGASDDLSYVYFVSKEDLAAGATTGENNLYLDHEGAITFIAMFADHDLGGGFTFGSGISNNLPGAVQLTPYYHNSRVTPDGRHIAFMSNRSLTGYDNTDANSGEVDIELFTYEAGGELICASCNPSGARPAGKPLPIPYYAGKPLEVWAAAWIPTWGHESQPPRALSDDGNRLFFNAFDALLPQDNDGKQDVYQWEAQGSGSCQQAGGCLSLISTGESSEAVREVETEFVDADPSGENVFFRTWQSIDPRDPGSMDIYDARVNGGFPLPPEAPECVGDACQSPPSPPNDPTPASASFHGAGNPVQRKARRSCRARSRHADKKAKHSKQQAKRCKRAKRRAGR